MDLMIGSFVNVGMTSNAYFIREFDMLTLRQKCSKKRIKSC